MDDTTNAADIDISLNGDSVLSLWGYDEDGYDKRGFDHNGIHRNGTPYDPDGWDVNYKNEDGEFREDMESPLPDVVLLAAATALRLALDRAELVVRGHISDQSRLVGVDLQIAIRLVARTSTVIAGYQHFGTFSFGTDLSFGSEYLTSSFYGAVPGDFYAFCALRHPEDGLFPEKPQSMRQVLGYLSGELTEIAKAGVLLSHNDLEPLWGDFLNEELACAAYFLTKEDLWLHSAYNIAGLGIRLAEADDPNRDLYQVVKAIEDLGGDLSLLRETVKKEDPLRDRWAYRRIMFDEKPPYSERRKMRQWVYKPYEKKGGK